VVYGLVHQESTATLITDLVMSHTSFERFRDLLFQILREHGGIDLKSVRREGASQLLWEEIENVQKTRKALLHRGDQPNRGQVESAVGLATTISEKLVPSVLHRLGLHLHEGVIVYGKALTDHNQRLRSR
jgi:hypothetical protein